MSKTTRCDWCQDVIPPPEDPASQPGDACIYLHSGRTLDLCHRCVPSLPEAFAAVRPSWKLAVEAARAEQKAAAK